MLLKFEFDWQLGSTNAGFEAMETLRRADAKSKFAEITRLKDEFTTNYHKPDVKERNLKFEKHIW